jgi:hypothetical protein
MLVPDITQTVEAIADRMVGSAEGLSLDALLEVAKAFNEGEERIKVEMLGRIASGAHPSDAVVAYLKLDQGAA